MQNSIRKALGVEQAQTIINRLTSSLQVRPFDFARRADPAQILTLSKMNILKQLL